MLPREMVNKFREEHIKTFKSLDIEFDEFSSTLCDEHEETVVEFFNNLYKNGLIEEKETLQLFDEDEKEFVADRFIEGTCPKCGYEKARGDECESCGSVFESYHLINPVSSVTKKPLSLKKAKYHYLKLSQCKDMLKDISQEKQWDSSILSVVNEYVKHLEDRCITRDIFWGVEVPKEYKSEGSNSKVFYVWFDAPIGYISITKHYLNRTNNSLSWKDFWKNENTEIINFMGKDNVMFHSVMFPLMQRGSDRELNIVDSIYSNNFFLLNNMKFSKSSGNVLHTKHIVDSLGSDVVRFYIALNAPESSDVSCSLKTMEDDTKAILIGKICNFVNRSLKFIQRYFDNKTPVDFDCKKSCLFETVESFSIDIKDSFSKSKVRKATQLIQSFSENLNRYFDTKKPWEMRKHEDKSCELREFLGNCIYGINALSVFLNPIVPGLTKNIASMLKSASGLSMHSNNWDKALHFNFKKDINLSDIKILVSNTLFDDLNI